jgi:glycosyltransferase involved in cell wall biosynthesis
VNKNIKVLHISTFDTGGAAKAMLRLHQGLLDKGIDSKVLVLYQNAQHIPEVYAFLNQKISFYQKLKNAILYRWDNFWKNKIKKRIAPQYEKFSFPTSIYDITTHTLYQEAHIIHLHWVADFLDEPSFFKKNQKPLVWTLHDQNPMLGGLHYELTWDTKDERTEKEEKKLLKFKQNILPATQKIHLVNPSTWMLKETSQSERLHPYPHYHITYGIPIDIFKPEDKQKARKMLGLPLDKKIILFIAENLQNKRKGFDYFQKAMQNLPLKNVCLLLVGNESVSNDFNIEVIPKGFIKEESQLALMYSAADITVVPSLKESLGFVMLESMACQTPVVAFPCGGSTDIIQHQANSLLADYQSIESLMEQIKLILENKALADELGRNARQTVVEKFSIELQAQKYMELYAVVEI